MFDILKYQHWKPYSSFERRGNRQPSSSKLYVKKKRFRDYNGSIQLSWMVG